MGDFARARLGRGHRKNGLWGLRLSEEAVQDAKLEI
jgi:hypothetical protein